MSEVTEYEATCVELARWNGARILARLRELGVELATAEYNGYGDSGQVEEVSFVGAEEAALAATVVVRQVEQKYAHGCWQRFIDERDVKLASAIRDLFYDALEAASPGWEINDGSQGTMSLNVHAGTVELSHEWNVTTTDHYEYEIPIST